MAKFLSYEGNFINCYFSNEEYSIYENTIHDLGLSDDTAYFSPGVGLWYIRKPVWFYHDLVVFAGLRWLYPIIDEYLAIKMRK